MKNVRATRAAFLTAHPAIANAMRTINEPVHARNFFAKDVLSKLDRYGSLSDRQVETVLASLARDVEFAARRAADDTEVKGDAPSGKVAVTGVVLSIKEQEGYYGWTRKMLMKLDTNARVWVSVPAASGIKKGDTATIRATWKVSDTDKSFAFGSRPVLVNLVPAVVDTPPMRRAPVVPMFDAVNADQEWQHDLDAAVEQEVDLARDREWSLAEMAAQLDGK